MSVAGSKLTVGVVGAGQIATDNHIPILRTIDGVSLTWVADVNANRARLVGNAFGIRPVVLARDESDLPPADVVLLAIPYGARAQLYDALAARGTAVYVEKPVARTVTELDRLSRQFTPSRLGVGLQRRSSASARTLSRAIRSELFGPLLGARVEFGGVGVRTGSYQSDATLAGGGLLFDVAVHSIDLALHVMAATAASVRHAHVIVDGGVDRHTDAIVDISLGARKPVSLEIFVSSLQHVRPCNTYRFEHATIVHEMWGEGTLTIRSEDDDESFLLGLMSAGYPVTAAQMFHAHWVNFLESVRTGVPNYTAAETARLVVDLTSQLYARA